jgi:hypothetical protein
LNLIQTELKNAESKMLAVIPGTDLVLLSPDNVAIVEAMIQNDSAYLKSSDKSAKPKGQYGGSTAYWMTLLKSILINSESCNIKYEDIIAGAVAAVDRENSTHLNADGVGRKEITERIVSINRQCLVYYLKEPDASKLELVRIIAEETNPIGVDKNGKVYRRRRNLSFASKFCHYACFYLFEGQPEQDNYSIYDNVLKKAMPKYIKHYGVEKRNLDDYAEYRKTVDDIITKASKKQISRNGFDHLLWYYFKGRI